MKTAVVCAATSVTLASCIVINEQKPSITSARQAAGASQVRGALSGQRQLLVSFYATAPDCTSLGYPTLKVAKPPQHGQVSVDHGTAFANFENGDVRSACNGTSVPATVIYYTSEPGFIGADSAEFERIGVAGAYGYHSFTINVR